MIKKVGVGYPNISSQNNKVTSQKTINIKDTFQKSLSQNDPPMVDLKKLAKTVSRRYHRDIKKVWTAYLLKSDDSPGHYEPVIRKDGIYINANGYTFKFDSNGKRVWKAKTGASGYSQPAFDKDGNIYVTNSSKELILLEKNGNVRRRVSLGSRGCSHTPLIGKDGKIYIVTDGDEVLIFNKKGDLEWSGEYDGLMSQKPFLDNNGILHLTATKSSHKLGWNSPYLILDTKAKHKEIKMIDSIDRLHDVAIDSQGTRYTFKDGKFRAITLEGKELWAIDLPGETTSSYPVFGPDKRLYVRVCQHTLLCLNPKDGKEIWRLGGPNNKDELSGDYAWASDGTMYITGDGGNWRIYAVSPDGKTKWVHKTPEHVERHKVGSDGTIFTGEEMGKLRAFSPETGNEISQYDVKLSFGDSYQVLSNGTIILATEDGTLQKAILPSFDRIISEKLKASDQEKSPNITIKREEDHVQIGKIRLSVRGYTHKPRN